MFPIDSILLNTDFCPFYYSYLRSRERKIETSVSLGSLTQMSVNPKLSGNLPCGWQKLKHWSHRLLLLKVCISQKLESWPESGVNHPKHSNVRCRCRKQQLSCPKHSSLGLVSLDWNTHSAELLPLLLHRASTFLSFEHFTHARNPLTKMPLHAPAIPSPCFHTCFIFCNIDYYSLTQHFKPSPGPSTSWSS